MSWGQRFPFVVIGPLEGIAMMFGGSEKGLPLILTPMGVCRSTTMRLSPCVCNFPRAPTRSGGLIKGRLIFVIVTPSMVSATGGVEPCHDFPLWTSHGARRIVSWLVWVGPRHPVHGDLARVSW